MLCAGMQELALAQSASDIAVAEVHAKDHVGGSKANREFLPSDTIDSTSTSITDHKSLPDAQEANMTKMMAAVVLQMNRTMNALSEQIYQLEQRVSGVSRDNKQVNTSRFSILS